MSLINQYKPDKYTKLLLHFNGDLHDSSRSEHPLDPSSGAFDISTKKFGSASLSHDGTNEQVLHVPDSNDFDFGTGDFTIDFWAYPGDTTYAHVLQTSPNSSTTRSGIVITMNFSNNWTFLGGSGASNWDLGTHIVFGSVSVGEWQHIAFVRSGTNFYLFKNGVLSGNEFTSALAIADNNYGVDLFSGLDNATWQGANVKIDELRISKGIARWTADFSANLPGAYADDIIVQPYKSYQDLIAIHPKHWFKLDSETLTDIGSSPIIATNIGSTLRVREGHNQHSARYFDGVDDEISVTDIGAIAQGSLSVWVKTVSDFSYVFGFGTGTSDFGGLLVGKGNLSGGYSDESIGWVSIGGTGGTYEFYVREGNAKYIDNQWHNIIVVIDGVDNRFYVDGKRVTVGFATGSAGTDNVFINTNPIGNISLGRRFYTGSFAYLDGYIQDLQIYDTVYLTDADAESIYKYGVVVKDPSIAGAYPELFTKQELKTINENRWEEAVLTDLQQQISDEQTRVITAEDF